MLFAVSIVLVHAVLAVHAGNPFAKTRPADDIEALCADKPVALLTISELEHLGELVGGSTCSANVKAAIPDLVALIKQTQNDLCARESIDKLREFYAKYLDTSARENKQRQKLPASLRKFALAYGMQMSSACKRRMVDVLTHQGKDVLYTNELRAIRGFASERSPLAVMLEGLAGPDDILLPSHLAPYIKDKSASSPDNDDNILYVQSPTSPYIRQTQANCNKHLAPIYRPLIRPIVQLTNMGFDYKDEPLRCNTDCPIVAMQLAKWSRLVFLCESLNNIYLVDTPASQTDNLEGKQAMRLLTKEETLAIESENFDNNSPEVTESEYGPVPLPSELILNMEDKKLKRTVKTFSTSKSEEKKIAKRLMGKGLLVLKTQLKRHNVGLIMSTGCKNLVHRLRFGENLRPSDEIVRVLDGAIGHESEYLDQPEDFDSKWDHLDEIARDVGMKLAYSVVSIMILAFIGMIIAFIVKYVLITALMASG